MLDECQQRPTPESAARRQREGAATGTVAGMSGFTFRVLTVNTHKGFGFFNRRFILGELREAVRATQADVVFLQEVIGQHELRAAKVDGWPEQPHYEYMADAIWPHNAYGRNAVYPHGHHGNALMSRFPIANWTNHDASHPGDETRGLLHAVLSPPQGPELHVICVHLGLQEAHRQQQLQQLCDLVLHGMPPDAPVVVAGDFNDWRLKGHRLLTQCAGLKEVFVAANGAPARTFPSRLPMLRLDRIYARNARVHKPVVLPRLPWSHLSDHAPLAAEIHV